ncbi:MAG: hypothetical protein Q9192_008665, partial [Flavoplaca navasiana]
RNTELIPSDVIAGSEIKFPMRHLCFRIADGGGDPIEMVGGKGDEGVEEEFDIFEDEVRVFGFVEAG